MALFFSGTFHLNNNREKPELLDNTNWLTDNYNEGCAQIHITK